MEYEYTHFMGVFLVLSNRGAGVIILNFVGDVLANLFLSGMFVRRLFLHIRLSKSVMTRQNRLIEHIARKSLLCLIFTFVINLAMNLLKLTRFIGDRSDVGPSKDPPSCGHYTHPWIMI